MKLLMISGDRSVLEGKRGAFWYTLQEFRKHWERIDVLCPRPDRSEESHFSLESRGISHRPEGHTGGDVFLHPSPSGLFRQKRWIVRKGSELVTEHHHDVMTVHEYPPFYNGRGAIALHRRTGVPFALEIHHIVGWPEAANVTEWVGAWLSRFFIPREARWASGVRTVNMTCQAKLISWGIPKERVCITPSFYLDRDLILSLKHPPIAYDLAFCARLVPNKGLLPLLDAVAAMPNVRLLVIGDGPLRERAEKRAQKLRIERRVTFSGWLERHEDVLAAITSARIFIVNSTSEGGPRVALEAMACGMPVISTRVGVMPEVIDDGVNGILMDGSGADLLTKVSDLLTDREKQRYLGEAAKDTLELFDREKLVAKYADFLKSLCAS